MLTISPDVVWIDGDGEIRLYDAAGAFQTLNSSAAEIWRRLAQGHSLDQIESELVTAYAAGDEHEARIIARDVREFVAALLTAGLLRETGDRPREER